MEKKKKRKFIAGLMGGRAVISWGGRKCTFATYKVGPVFRITKNFKT